MSCCGEIPSSRCTPQGQKSTRCEAKPWKVAGTDEFESAGIFVYRLNTNLVLEDKVLVGHSGTIRVNVRPVEWLRVGWYVGRPRVKQDITIRTPPEQTRFDYYAYIMNVRGKNVIQKAKGFF